MRLHSNGYLGIGNNNPAYILDINQTTGISYDNYIRYKCTAHGSSGQISTSYIRLERNNYGGAIGGYLHQGVGAGLVLGTISNGTLSNQMTIKSNGKVGIGITNPDAKLQVEGDIHVRNQIDFDYQDWQGTIQRKHWAIFTDQNAAFYNSVSSSGLRKILLWNFGGGGIELLLMDM